MVVLSKVYIWKLWWLALALSGLMLDLSGGEEAQLPERHGAGADPRASQAQGQARPDVRRPGLRLDLARQPGQNEGRGVLAGVPR